MIEGAASAYAARKIANRIAVVATSLAVVMVVVPLCAIMVQVLANGLGGLSTAFFTELPRPPTVSGGGLANAVLGTLELVILACIIGIPLGVAAGLYLAEYRMTPLARVARLCADVLAGVPSILVGVVVYAVVVVRMKHFSGFAGAGALAILMLPLVARTTDELARSVPDSLREAALALGAPRHRIAVHIVLRTAAPGIGAGTMLAVARVCGETAPLLFTAFDNDFWAATPLDPAATMQVRIFFYTLSSSDDRHVQAWAAALVLVFLVIVLNVVARRLWRGRAG